LVARAAKHNFKFDLFACAFQGTILDNETFQKVLLDSDLLFVWKVVS